MEVRFESSAGNLIWHLPKDFSNTFNNAPPEIKHALLKVNQEIVEKLCSFLLGVQRSVPFLGPKVSLELIDDLLGTMDRLARKALSELEKHKDNPMI